VTVRARLLALLALLAGAGPCAAQEAPPEAERPFLTLGDHQLRFGLDLTFAAVRDEAQRASFGREQQVKPAYVLLAVGGVLNERLSYEVIVNPVEDQIVPRPYVPGATDTRVFFFPNQPEGRGVSSDPEGLYKVDFYKHPGLDPVIQQGALRVGFIDVHGRGQTLGVRAGRFYVPQGLQLAELVWFTARDLTHIQAINAQADNGLLFYGARGPVRADVAVVTGNGSPYHDYGYFDFTDPSEDKNSALAVVASVRATVPRVTVGGTFRRNFINSRVEDSLSLQLSKRNDNAAIVFAKVQPWPGITVFGEYARYKWGLAQTSADLLPGPQVETPVVKDGFYAGADYLAPRAPFGRLGITVTHEDLSRDDSLVSWAAANGLFDVTLGERERATIVKVRLELSRQLSAFWFGHWLENPFPELSAIKPIAGMDVERVVSHDKFGVGLRLRF
jgi:hypothetical protein